MHEEQKLHSGFEKSWQDLLANSPTVQEALRGMHNTEEVVGLYLVEIYDQDNGDSCWVVDVYVKPSDGAKITKRCQVTVDYRGNHVSGQINDSWGGARHHYRENMDSGWPA